MSSNIVASTLPFLLSLLFIFSFPHPSHCTSLTCKDAVIQYWKLKFGDDKPPPPSLFLEKLSALSPLELAANFANAGITMVPKDDNHRSLKVVVDADLDRYDPAGAPGTPGPAGPFLLYDGYRSSKDKRAAAATGDADSASDDNIRVDEVKERAEGMINVDSSLDSSPSASLSSMFFREKDLKKGATLLLPDFGSKYPPLTFLPRSIASNIPLSASAIREMFKIPRGTRWDKGIEENIGLCEGAPNKGETKRCVASAEDMIDLVVQLLGTNATARTTESYNGAGGKILIGDVKAVNDGKLGTSLACHQTLLPYLVHLCHTLPNSRVYEFEILDVETRKKINSGAAVCHVHVSGSEADHGHGEDPVCHWIFKWDMIWTTIIQH